MKDDDKKISDQVLLMHEEDAGLGNLDATLILQRLTMSPHKEVIQTNLSWVLYHSVSLLRH